MSDLNFDDFGDIDLKSNPDPRCPLVLILDSSDSMSQPIPGQSRTALDHLNSGLDILISELNKDPLARRRVEVSVVAYGTHVLPATPFATVENLVIPTLAPMGITSTGGAVCAALDALDTRKKEYRENGIEYYRAMLFLLSDGLPTDDVSEAIGRVKEAERRKSASFFALGVDGADLGALGKFSDVREPMPVSSAKFAELFSWLSASQAMISASQPGDEGVALPSPAGWATLDV
jgi:uncharacterized protein YegL